MSRLSLLLLLAATTSALRADFPAIYNSEPDKNAAPMPAEAAAQAIELPPGFQCTLFAAEPQVQNPVAMTWDAKGRLWVAENYTYAERAKRFDLSLRDRVIILEDKDHDGKAETHTVFTDKVQMLTSVEVGHGGVWLMCPPQVLFIPDKNGDDVPDAEPQVVLDGFTVAESNYHNFANGLRWGPDGWLYGRCGHSCPGLIGKPGTPESQRIPIKGGLWRYHPVRQVFESLTHGTTNPWGHDWDQYGECFFVNTVTGHLWHLMPGAHLKDSSPSPNTGIYDRLDTIADHYHFDTSGGWQKSRGGSADSLGGGHAHIGAMIYQADQWPPPMRGKLMTVNMHGRRVNVERLEPSGNGYVGRHEPDILKTKDEWFRGIDLSTGPDGSVYIIDWSDTGECHESTGVHRTSGRIYRISNGKPATPDLSALAEFTPANAGKLLGERNAWYYRQLFIQAASLTENGSQLPPALKAGQHDRKWWNEQIVPLVRQEVPSLFLRFIWLDSLMFDRPGKAKLSLLSHPNLHLRTWAVRLVTDAWPLDTIMGPHPQAVKEAETAEVLPSLIDLAKTEQAGLVRLALASTLQRLPMTQRASLALPLAAHVEDAADAQQPSLVWFGITHLAESDPAALVKVVTASQWPDLYRWAARRLVNLPEVPPALNDLLSDTARPLALRQALMHGLDEGLAGQLRAKAPPAWAAFAKAITEDDDQPTLRKLGAIFGDGMALEQIEAIALDSKAELAARQNALRTLMDQRVPKLAALCTTLLDTKGLAPLALRGLAQLGDPSLDSKIIAAYRKLSPTDRATITESLVARPSLAKLLLQTMKDGKLPHSELSPFLARQIQAHNDEALTKLLTEAWGELRSTAADKQALIAKLKTNLTPEALAKADKSQGRLLFSGICAACHQLYGQGNTIGPDLTGSGRASLDYLLENIADPSGVVSADYRMTILTLKDGRVMTGIIRAQTDSTLTLRTMVEETTVTKADIQKQDTPPLSMMPEGLFAAMNDEQVRNLIAYLMHPVQVDLPK